MEWNNTCRTCLTTNNTLESVYSSPDPLALEYEYWASYLNMIKSVTSISIAPNDTLPQQICQKCINDLLIAFNFQKFTIKTEEALQLLRVPENDIVNEPLSLNHDMDMVEVKQEIFSPNQGTCNININKSDLSVSSKCEVQEQIKSELKVEDSILTHDTEKLKQQNKLKQNYKVISKKFKVVKSIETPNPQLPLKNNIKKIKTHQEQQNILKPPEIKIKSLQSLQNQIPTNAQRRHEIIIKGFQSPQNQSTNVHEPHEIKIKSFQSLQNQNQTNVHDEPHEIKIKSFQSLQNKKLTNVQKPHEIKIKNLQSLQNKKLTNVQEPHEIKIKGFQSLQNQNPTNAHEPHEIKIKSVQSLQNQIPTNVQRRHEIIMKGFQSLQNQSTNVHEPHEIKIKSVQSLQNKNPTNVQPVQLNNNINAQKLVAPWVTPPPLVFLSESKTTPPPLVFLPVKPVDNCQYCDLKFTTEYDLKVHLLTHEINLNCVSICHFCWETPKDLLRHLAEHYKYLTCVQCSVKFESISEFENHMKEHFETKTNVISPNLKTSRIDKCRICGVTLKLINNICWSCKTKVKYLCPFCGKEFVDIKLFAQHERNH